MGVNRGGVESRVPQQQLDVPPFRPGVQEMGGIDAPEFVQAKSRRLGA